MPQMSPMSWILSSTLTLTFLAFLKVNLNSSVKSKSMKSKNTATSTHSIKW